MNIPENVIHALERLEEAGFEAWLVGGCVRDSLMGRTPGDYDICTSALPEETAAAFAAEAVARGTRQIVLAHLSQDNNTPSRAEAASRAVLAGKGELYIAPRDELLRLDVCEGANVLCRK